VFDKREREKEQKKKNIANQVDFTVSRWREKRRNCIGKTWFVTERQGKSSSEVYLVATRHNILNVD